MALAQGALASGVQNPTSSQHVAPVTSLGDVASDRGPVPCPSPVRPRGCQSPDLVSRTVVERNESPHVEIVGTEDTVGAVAPVNADVSGVPIATDGGDVLAPESPSNSVSRNHAPLQNDVNSGRSQGQSSDKPQDVPSPFSCY